MKNRLIQIISLTTVIIIITGMCACARNKPDDSKYITHRSVTLSTTSTTKVKEDPSVIAVAPKGAKNIADYFNGSLVKFNNVDFDFNKSLKTELVSFSAGDLNKVEGATDTYRSTLRSACSDMMGVVSLDTAYYVGDDKREAVPISDIDTENVQTITAKAQENKVVIDVVYKPLSEDGIATVQQLTADYISNASFNEKIHEYEGSASSTNVKISNVRLKAVIDYTTRNFETITITFSTAFKAESLSLGYVSGGPVTGETKTTVIYKDFAEK